ncbi:MAG: matrixin family metalloprotease [Rubrobacteraceae bacterium]|jgi:hypothetical protein
MGGWSMVGGVFAGVAGRIAKFVAGVAIAAVAATILADEADAQVNIQADSDGYVPVIYSCWAGNEVGLYSWHFDGYTTTGTITINSCLLDSMGAGPNNYQAVIDHEMGHVLGYGHSHDPYSAMYPVTTITGSRRRFVTIRKIRRLPSGE